MELSHGSVGDAKLNVRRVDEINLSKCKEF